MTTGKLALVAERQNFYSAGLAAMLQREVGFSRVIRVNDMAALYEVLAQDEPTDLLAFDLDLPGADGIATVSELHMMRPGMRIAVVSDRSDVQEVLAVLAAGAHGFIPRQMTDCVELLRALKIVEDMGVFVPPGLVSARPGERALDGADATSGTLAKLTERQQQVIELLSEGHANKVIARELGISPSTVKVHVHAAFRTLGVHSRLAALAALRSARQAPPIARTNGAHSAIAY
jgi:DNA-binding NarL/FixJ family response regulator